MVTEFAPTVTAVITTYQRFDDAKRAIQSVVAQTYQPLEIIVVEDGTDSGIEAWLKAQGLTQVRYIRHPYNRGLAAARNTGWQAASGEYVAYLDDDDIWKPERISRQIDLVLSLSAVERTKTAVVTCATEMYFPRNGRVSVRMPQDRGSLEQAMMNGIGSTPSSSFLFLKNALEKVGGFDEKLVSSVDHDIWMSLAVEGFHTDFVPEPLVIHFDRFRRHSAMSATERRIAGVRQYIEKWLPTYRKWFGELGAQNHARWYFGAAVGLLGGTKLAEGRVGEAVRALETMIHFRVGILRSVIIVLRCAILTLLRQYAPASVINYFRQDSSQRNPASVGQ